jgi:D-alanyl-D-alanine carboxypeptidase
MNFQRANQIALISCALLFTTQPMILAKSWLTKPSNSYLTANSRSANQTRQSLDERVKGIMARQHIPGMAVVVIRNGVPEFKNYGVADINTKQPVTANTKFPIGSVSKPFTAMAIMMLVEEGKVKLDEPISKFFFDLPAQWSSLTLRQLLSHQAGLSEDVNWQRTRQTRDIFKEGNWQLDFPPGESWSYSNIGFNLAGLIIEKVSGQSYSQFMRDRIFLPLKMYQTQASFAATDNLATSYSWQDRLEIVGLPADHYVMGTGSIISTANDMTKWLQALDRGQLLSKASYQQLWTSTSLNSSRKTGYGLGWFVGNYNGHPYTEHGGNVGGYTTGVYRYPQDQLGIIVLTNNIELSGSQIANAIADFYQPNISLFSVTETKPDPNPEANRRLLRLLQGKPDGISFTPDFLLRQKTLRGQFAKSFYQQFQEVDHLDFLQTDIQNGDTVYIYQSQIKGKLFIASITITNQQQVAGYGAGFRL